MRVPTSLLPLLALLSLALPASNAAHGSDLCSGDNNACQKVGSWEFSVAVGLGGRTNPVLDGDDQPIVLIPSFSWYGKRFFIDTFEAGYTFVDTEKHMLNALVQPGFDQVYFDEFGFGNFALGDNFSGGGIAETASNLSGGSFTDGQIVTPDQGAGSPPAPEGGMSRNNGDTEVIIELQDRKLAVLGGLEYSYFNGPWQLQLAALHDISQIHDGSEIKLAASYQYRFKNNLINIAAGAAWQSQKLLDYYYGLDATEVNLREFEYEADDGISSFIKISWSKRLSERWNLVSALHLRKFDNELKGSPLLEEDLVTTVFIGGRYHF